MNNGDIRKRGWAIFKAAPVALLVAGGYSTVAGIIIDEADSLLVSIPLAVISVLITIGGYYMYIRGWVEGRADLKHLLVPFQNPVYRNKILPIFLMELLILCLAAVPLVTVIVLTQDPVMLLMNGAFLLLLLILFAVVAVAISLVWYIFVMEPELKVFEMFKKSAVYMARHWAGLMWFRLTIMIIPMIVSVVLMQIIDEEIITLLLIPVDAYIAMAGIGYVYENILMEEKRKELMLAEQAAPPPTAESTENLPAETPVEENIDEENIDIEQKTGE